MKLYIKPQSDFIEVYNEGSVIMASQKLDVDPNDQTDEQLIGSRRETLDWNE